MSVTAPFRASTRPVTVTSVLIVIEASARTVPENVEPRPNVAVPATCQKTLQALAPLTSLTELDGAVTRSELAWKTHAALGSFLPSSVRTPVTSSVALPAL